MDLLIIIFVGAVCLAIPVKCYQDGEYKKMCLEMRGKIETEGAIDNCIFPETHQKEQGE